MHIHVTSSYKHSYVLHDDNVLSYWGNCRTFFGCLTQQRHSKGMFMTTGPVPYS